MSKIDSNFYGTAGLLDKRYSKCGNQFCACKEVEAQNKTAKSSRQPDELWLIEYLRDFIRDTAGGHAGSNGVNDKMWYTKNALNITCLAKLIIQLYGNPPATVTIADYEDVLADHRRLVREMDVALNGEEGAAKQASLCDIVSQVKSLKRELVAPAHNYWQDVFKGADCFEKWANNNAFWEKQPYGTRFYFGDGAFDYVNREVLGSAVKQLNQAKPISAKIEGGK